MYSVLPIGQRVGFAWGDTRRPPSTARVLLRSVLEAVRQSHLGVLFICCWCVRSKGAVIPGDNACSKHTDGCFAEKEGGEAIDIYLENTCFSGVNDLALSVFDLAPNVHSVGIVNHFLLFHDTCKSF